MNLNNSDKTSEAELQKSNDNAANIIDDKNQKFHTNKIGVICTSFQENLKPQFEGNIDFPKSYYTLNGKERLLLLFAENFRRQYNEIYLSRRPLIMAIENECSVQKFVSTTIRPTALLYPELIGSWKEIAKFVADFILYEPLENPVLMPSRLISPDTLLKRRKGNSFEMATLLCSFLIGNGYAAMVVSGYANREVANNDQQRVICPFIPTAIKEEELIETKELNKYSLRDPPNLNSKFLIEVEQRKFEQIEINKKREETKMQAIREALEKLEDDPFDGQRLHAWVVIVKNAQWTYKREAEDETAIINSEEEIVEQNLQIEPTAIFIEPSTGFHFDNTNLNYLGIESVWNQYNYYINRQEPISEIKNMHWNFQNTNHWEHLLAGEPYELRVERPLPDDIESLSRAEELSKEKHLDMPASWVNQLNISQKEFEERFPNGEKLISFKRGIYERFCPYKKQDGLVKRLTLFETLDYKNSLLRWEWYENRSDLLQFIKIDFITKQIEEYFIKGRSDCLKSFIHNADPMKERIFEFYYVPKLDALKTLETHPTYIREYYHKRNDFLHFREYQISKEKSKSSFSETKTSLTNITEKFHKNSTIESDTDISIRNFQITQNKIFLQFHYRNDAITASTKIYLKPPPPNYGCEIIYDPNCVIEYNASPTKKAITQVEQYLLLLEQLKAEEQCKFAFDERCKEIEELLALRKSQMINPKLTFNIFDPLRNSAARKLRMAKYEELKQREELVLRSKPDYLAPYLIIIGDGQTKPNYEDSQLIIRECLNDLKTNYLEMLNELQKRYDELIAEEANFKRFLNKFHTQFDDFDYEQLIKDGENIELNKITVQQRIINTKDEFDRKYRMVKDSLMNDDRLTNVNVAD